jgi:UDP-glucose 4-epimerase
MHFAALSLVGESMADPGRYWRVNVGGAANLVEAALEAGCRDRMVFSSTCATYGDQDGVLLDEDTPQRPINAYGGSKRAIEEMLRDFGAAHGLRIGDLPLFQRGRRRPRGRGRRGAPARDASHPGDAGGHRRAMRPALTMHGTDYDTPDGTCIRDYVHVCDLVDAHVLGLRRLLEGAGGRRLSAWARARGFRCAR